MVIILNMPLPTNMLRLKACYIIFFFQAEDGIRDRTVTGVQTCALPISVIRRRPGESRQKRVIPPAARIACAIRRSEERRVGKEGRSPWSLDHEKKKYEVHPRTPQCGVSRT